MRVMEWKHAYCIVCNTRTSHNNKLYFKISEKTRPCVQNQALYARKKDEYGLKCCLKFDMISNIYRKGVIFMGKTRTTKVRFLLCCVCLISLVFGLPFNVYGEELADLGTAQVVTAPSAEQLTYTGEGQHLVTEGAASNGTMVYSLTEDAGFTDQIPTAVNAGDYVVYYYVQGDDGYTSSDMESITVTIHKADAVVVTAPVANELTYNGENQLLVTPGEASGGVMMYNPLSNAASGFSETVPSRKMGYYDVWYYVKGDKNHNDSEKAKVGVTIAKAVIEGPIEVVIETPVAGATPQKSIYFDKYQAQILWTPSVTTFKENAEYRASVTIQPKISRAYCFDAKETEKFIVKMKNDGWTVYGNANSISMNKTFSTKVLPKVSVIAQDQSIVYGEKIVENAYVFSGETTGISVRATLTPSTENVTANGMILLSDVIILEGGRDVTEDYEVILQPGKLVINPDVSEIEGLTTENVTKANSEAVESVQNMMASAETEGIDEETQKAWDEITIICRALIEQIEKIQADLAQVRENLALYGAANVKSTDTDALTQLSADTAVLLNTENLDSDERTEMETNQADITELLARIDAAEVARNTENIIAAQEITADNVLHEDKTVLETAMEELTAALDSYAGNYTKEETQWIEEERLRLESIITVIDQADAVTEKINALPERIDPDDQEALDQLLDAENDYSTLTDHATTLVSEDAREKLVKLREDVSEDTTEDNTEDNTEDTAVYCHVYRLYNAYTQEHLLTSDLTERDSLLSVGWSLDGIAWNAPETGEPVYRLYNLYDDWHTYTMNQEEIDLLTALGWEVDGVVTCSTQGEAGLHIYRLFNPYEQKNYHLLTAAEDERAMLEALGWQLDGIAWNCLNN